MQVEAQLVFVLGKREVTFVPNHVLVRCQAAAGD
jgi:hypothetical protein